MAEMIHARQSLLVAQGLSRPAPRLSTKPIGVDEKMCTEGSQEQMGAARSRQALHRFCIRKHLIRRLVSASECPWEMWKPHKTDNKHTGQWAGIAEDYGGALRLTSTCSNTCSHVLVIAVRYLAWARAPRAATVPSSTAISVSFRASSCAVKLFRRRPTEVL